MRTQGLASEVFSSKHLCLTVAVLSAAFFSVAPAHPQSIHTDKKTVASSQSVTNTGYGNLPISFEPNVGQSQNQVKFLAHATGYSLFLTPSETVLLLREVQKSDRQAAGDISQRLRGAVLGIKFLNANSRAELSASNKLTGRVNYLLGNDPVGWHTNVPTFERVTQHELYPGIDLVYYGNQRQLEYDFVVSPQANPDAIRMSFSGSSRVRVDTQGNLVVSVATGDLQMRRPVAYQEQPNGERQLVAASYVVRGPRRAGIALGKYDPTRQLIIDPILEYSTYLGGTNIDSGNGIAVAQDKTAFIAGGTFSTNFPTAHPLQPNHGGPDDFSRDAFVSKISADGSTLLYSTYLGGTDEDVANGIAVDTFGNAYVTGTTISANFPVTPGSFNTECGGDGSCGATLNPHNAVVSNAFVTKLNPEGSALIYSGFLGEYEPVKGQAITVDANQVAYVTGQTGPNQTPTVPIIPPNVPPPPFPITPNAAQPIIGGATDAFLSKISATGTTILYSTYIGGENEDYAFGIAVDANSNAYVTGLTYSTTFPVTGGAFQSANQGAGDAFLTKISTAGGPFLYSTLLGGPGLDQGNAVAVDPNGNAFLAGQISSGGFVSPRAYGGNGDAFVAKFNSSLSGAASLVFFTYLGGSLADTANGIALDSSGNIYVAGSTVSADFPVVGAVFQPTYGGGNADAFVAKLDPTGSILYSSFLGGSNTDSAFGIAVDSDGSAYVTGQTCSLDFPLTNPEQASAGGNCDAFVTKVSILSGIILNPNGLVFQSLNVGATSQPQTVTLTTGDSAVTITSVSLAGPNPADFAQTTSCGSSVPSGTQCTFTVSFSPTSNGLRKASLVIADTENGNPTTHVVALTGSTSTVQLSTSSLSFGPQSIGVASSAQTITVTNVGNSPLTISNIVASNDFGETDNCTKAPLQPSNNCTINVTYTPTSAGSALGALTINDNVPGSPQVVLLNGKGLTPDFSVSVSPASATIAAGSSTTVTVTVASISGFAQTVSLLCSGLPAGATCSGPQPSVTLTPNGSVSTSVTISTVARTIVPPIPFEPHRHLRAPLLPVYVVAMIVLLIWFSRLLRQPRRRLVTVGLLLVAPILLLVACNGGSSASVSSGTPAGTYQVVITGAVGSTSHSAPVTLIIK